MVHSSNDSAERTCYVGARDNIPWLEQGLEVGPRLDVGRLKFQNSSRCSIRIGLVVVVQNTVAGQSSHHNQQSSQQR